MNGKIIKTIDLEGSDTNADTNADIKTNIMNFQNILDNMDLDIEYKVICKNGYKSMVVESLIKNQILKRQKR